MASARTAFLGYQTGLARAFYLLSPDYRQRTAPACRAIHDTGSLRGTRLSAAPRIIPANLHRPIYFFIDRIAAGQALRLPEGQTLKDFRIKEGRLFLIYKKHFIRHILVGSPFQFPSVRIRNFLLEIMADLAGVLGAWNTP